MKWVGVGDPGVTPLVPFIELLLTLTDGQGDVSIGGALRVIILSGAAEGHEVPQGAKTVESDWKSVNQCSDDWNAKKDLVTCAEATRARVTRMNFMMFVPIGKGKRFG